jgi:hypothetical protein
MRVAPRIAASTEIKKSKEVKQMDKNVKTGVAAAAGVTGAQTAATAAGISIPVIGTLPVWVFGVGGVAALVLAYKALTGSKK